MMTFLPTQRSRAGISLMEVLISIGVIAVGIFGVASLIPVAQFKVAEGTSKDRIASLGPSAAAQFRIQKMGDPNNWVVASRRSYEYVGGIELQQSKLMRSYLKVQPYCIDPLGLAEGAGVSFPANAVAGNSLLSLNRIGLKGINDVPVAAAAVALARKQFYLQDEIVFDLPDDQAQQPRRQFFSDSNNRATGSVANASMSWFATLSPVSANQPGRPNKDEFVLSIVVVKNRVPLLASTEENFALAGSRFAGEVVLQGAPGPKDQLKVSDLEVGDWILLSKPVGAPSNSGEPNFVCRWTQIIGSSVEESKEQKTFTVGNDDFLRPEQTLFEQNASAIFVRGVQAVYERTIRLDRLRELRLR